MKTQVQLWLLVAALVSEVACTPEISSPIQKTAPKVTAPTKNYPPTRRDDITEQLHGTSVRDPYRWLEDPTRPEVAAWMTTQDNFARANLAKLKGRDTIAKRLAAVMYYDAISAPIHRGGRYFYTRKHLGMEKRVVYWKPSETSAEKVLLDPNTWSSDGAIGLKQWFVSRDGRYIAYNVSEHNEDETSLWVLEVETGKRLPDTIPHTRFGTVSWAPAGHGFYYDYTPAASTSIPESERSAHTQLRFHILGQDPAKDPVIRDATHVAGWFVEGRISDDGHWLLVAIAHGSSGPSDWYFQDLRETQPRWITLVEGIEADFSVMDFQDRFYVMTNDGASRYHLLMADPKHPARTNWHKIVAEAALSIYGDEPGILVQRSRINVQLRATRTFIRNVSRAEIAPCGRRSEG